MHDHLDLGPHALLDVIGREFRTDGLRSDNVPLTCLIQQG
ncbi:hypothetical protein BCEP4_260018 [Burkholderia cepacia]|nr:hypothetical protein BCEP4_260018 [Burkholderia cepacia]